MPKSVRGNRIGSMFIIFIGVLLIAYGLVHISLGILGERDTAVITSIRRQGGERAEAIPNRYTYSIGYSFTLPDGRSVDGFTYKIGNSVYIKASGSNTSFVPVRYFKAIPQINALERETGLKPGSFIIIAAGLSMIGLLKQKRK